MRLTSHDPGRTNSSPTSAGLLIVNADDFGGNRLATDRILECFSAKAITSTSAMMYMSDSRRAAALSQASDLPVGLHLNLTQAFEDPRTPGDVRARQARAVGYFASGRRRRFTYNPFVSTLVKACVADQLACFRQLFGREPTHIDGHNHVHLSPTALLALPRGARVRGGEDPPSGGLTPKAVLARARHAVIAQRHVTTDHFYAIDRLGDSPSVADVQALLAPASRSTAEVMTHPNRERDYTLLMSDAWRSALRGLTCGSFVQLDSGSA